MSSGVARDWGDLRAFLAVVRAGSTLGAAQALGVNHTTLGRRIRSLEHDLGQTLFERDTRGCHLTTGGAVLRPHAEAVAAAVAALEAEAARGRRASDEVIRLNCPYPLLDDIMQPVVGAFLAEHPKVRFDCRATRETVDMQAGAADVALRFADVIEGDDVVRFKLPSFRWGVYCSRDYAARHGAPACMEEVAQHRVIGFEGAIARSSAYRWFRERVPREAFVAHCDVHDSMRAILESGAGVGPVTCRSAARSPELVQCFAPEEMTIQFWLLVSPQAHRRKSVRAFVRFAAPRIKAMLLDADRTGGRSPEAAGGGETSG